jgi:hypothetical protein
MAAPERFAEKSDSSCTAGTVHTWPITTDMALEPNVGFRGYYGSGWSTPGLRKHRFPSNFLIYLLKRFTAG